MERQTETRPSENLGSPRSDAGRSPRDHTAQKWQVPVHTLTSQTVTLRPGAGADCPSQDPQGPGFHGTPRRQQAGPWRARPAPRSAWSPGPRRRRAAHAGPPVGTSRPAATPPARAPPRSNAAATAAARGVGSGRRDYLRWALRSRPGRRDAGRAGDADAARPLLRRHGPVYTPLLEDAGPSRDARVTWPAGWAEVLPGDDGALGAGGGAVPCGPCALPPRPCGGESLSGLRIPEEHRGGLPPAGFVLR